MDIVCHLLEPLKNDFFLYVSVYLFNLSLCHSYLDYFLLNSFDLF